MRRALNNGFWSLADGVILFTTNLFYFSLLIKLIGREEIGYLGLAGSYSVFTTVIDIGIASIFLREDTAAEKRNLRLTATFAYGILRTIAVVLLACGICAATAVELSPRLVLIVFLFTLSSALGNLSLPAIEFIYSQFRQDQIAKIKFFARLLQLSILPLLIVFPNVICYVCLSIFTSACELSFWVYWLRRSFHFQPSRNLRAILGELKFVFHDFAIWSHLVNLTLMVVYQLDVFVLQYFAGKTTLGDYTVALKTANYLFLVPAILEKNMIVVLSRVSPGRRDEVFGILFKYNLIFCVIQGLGLYFLLRPYFGVVLNIPYGQASAVIALFLPLAIGTTLRNLIRPHTSMILHRHTLLPFLKYVTGPIAMICVALYVYAAHVWGAAGLAWANPIIYCLLLIGTGIFTKKSGMVRTYQLRWTIIEKQLLHGLLRSVRSLRFSPAHVFRS